METETKLAMLTTHLITATSSSAVISSTNSPGLVQGESFDNTSFPAGLRVLVVDDDPICLLILDRMLCRCLYKVTTCKRAIEALNILRERKHGFDLVISDVCMPDMDGFKLLELVGLEMDLPVIMMSANGETSAVMKGIKHGACDYLLKPVRIEELKNIWQHVVRRKYTGNFEDRQRADHCGEHHASPSDGLDVASKHLKKRKDMREEEEDFELDNDDPTSKRPRVVWSQDLHQQFVSAVNQLGIDKAVPKRILELMNVKGLSRENVASHLQKYRLYLKRISGVAHHTGDVGAMFAGAPKSSFDVVGRGLGDFRALSNGQLSPQIFASTLQAGLLGRLAPNKLGMDGLDPSLLMRFPPMHGGNNGALVSPLVVPSLNTSGSLHPAILSGLDLKHLSNGSQQIELFGHLDKGLAGLATLQQLSVEKHLARLNNDLSASPSNNSLTMHSLQQQTGLQMASCTSLNTSTGGQQILSGDIGAKLPYVSGFNSEIGNSVGAYLRPGQNPSTMRPIDGLGFLGTVPMDNAIINFSCPGNATNSLSAYVSSPSMSRGIDGGINATSKNGCVSNAGEVLPQSVRGVLSNSVNTWCSNWQACQSLGLSQELAEIESSISSPHHNQGSSTDEAWKSGCVQAKGSGCTFQDNVGVDIRCCKPLVTPGLSYSERPLGERDFKSKEVTFELPKAENGMTSEAFLSPDDLLIFQTATTGGFH